MTSEMTPLQEVHTPTLRIVPTGKLRSHELHDDQRATPLIERLQHEEYLKNPPIVAAVEGDDRYIILDGANRAVALDVLGYGHALVQIVPYQEPDVELRTWHHAVSNVEPAILAQALRSAPGIELGAAGLTHARGLLAARAILAYCILTTDEVLTMAGGGLDLRARNQLLRAIVQSYIHIGTLNRTNSEDLAELVPLYPGLAGAVIFPRYEPSEVLDLAQSGLKLPPGLTRHIIHGRALRVNYPLAWLREPVSLAEKNRRLAAWLQEKYERRAVRYYAESTYVFDE